MISTNKSTSSVDELFSNAFAVWKSQGIYDLEKRLAAGSRVKKPTRRVKRCNAPAGSGNERSSNLSMSSLEHKQVKKSREKTAPRANALENAFAYVRFTMYDVRFINNVRIAQKFSNRQRMQGLLYNHQHDECLLS